MTPGSLLNRVLFFSLLILALLVHQTSYAQTEPDSAAASGESEASAAADSGGLPTDDASISEGESLFKANCMTCHRVDRKLVGPALAGVYDRTPSLDWIVNFVHNSQKVIQSGDEYANNLYNEFNKTQMTAFPMFKREQILGIMAYIKQQAEAAPATDNGGSTGDQNQPENQVTGGAAVSQTYLDVIMIGLVIVLVLILIVLVLITSVLKRYLNQQGEMDEDDSEIVNSTINIGAMFRSKAFIFMVTFIFAAIAFKVVINELYAVGIQKGYSPKQPIAFSHKLHAGQYNIDCQYCHTGVRKSKNANIPSPNICMNCHSQIKTESPEIQKIYAAVENDKPIEWVRIHNLPDLAYFNHSQHVKVGNIECQTCHGQIQEMEQVQQHALLTMGWCIDCHRKTDVNTKGNVYYDNLVELHDKVSKDALKVEDIGGIECSKCHY